MGRLRAVSYLSSVFVGSVVFAPGVSAQTVPSGIVQVKNPSTNLCLNVNGGGYADNTNLIIYPCGSATNEQYRFVAIGDAYRIVGVRSSKCLTLENDVAQAHMKVVQYTCGQRRTELWNPIYLNGKWTLKNKASGNCAGRYAHQTAVMTPITMGTCENTGTYEWNFNDVQASSGGNTGGGGTTTPTTPASQTMPVDTFRLINRTTNYCADVSGAETANESKLIDYPCHDGGNQQFKLVRKGDAHYIVNIASAKCLGAERDGAQAGAGVSLYSCEQRNTQLWQPVYVNGAWRMKNKANGLCMGVRERLETVAAPLSIDSCDTPTTFSWSFDDPNYPANSKGKVGAWSAPVSFPIVPVTMSMLFNGKLMLMSGSGRTTFGGANQTYTVLYDPATGSQQAKLLNKPSTEYFCEGTALLGDGSLLVTGGSNTKSSTLMDANGNFVATPNLNIARGYAGQTITSEGKVFTVGGSWSGGVGIKKGELYTPGSGWKVLDGVVPTDFNTSDPAGLYRQDNHMWLAGASGGWVLHAGPSKKMHWVSTAGSGSIVSAGTRGSMDNMNGNAVVYDIGKMLTLGGAAAYNHASPTAAAHIVDFSAAPPAPPRVTQTGSMAYARSFANSVVLPSGEVVTVGGAGEGATAFSDVNSVLAAEIWSPSTRKFAKAAAMQTPRNYHSVATLLMDGRVIAAGGGLCGCSADHPNAELFSPPYLWTEQGEPAPRPLISSAPTSASRGSTVNIVTRDASSFALVRMGSGTHSVNNDQRRIPLTIASRQNDSVSLRIPSDAGVVLPGNYLLFALNLLGTPSVARPVNIR
ncbi:MAG: RICIN domain-containing protein [Rhodoblastus sp.]